MNNREITSEQLAQALDNPRSLVGEPNTCFICEKMTVFKIDEDGKFMQACTRSNHGVHRRFEKANRAMQQFFAAVGSTVSVECPDCGGSGWFAYDDPNAIRNRVLSNLCGIFRGIKLPHQTKELTVDRLRDTLESCFIGSLPSEPVTDPPDPIGTGDPDRVDLFPKQQ